MLPCFSLSVFYLLSSLGLDLSNPRQALNNLITGKPEFDAVFCLIGIGREIILFEQRLEAFH